MITLRHWLTLSGVTSSDADLLADVQDQSHEHVYVSTLTTCMLEDVADDEYRPQQMFVICLRCADDQGLLTSTDSDAPRWSVSLGGRTG